MPPARGRRTPRSSESTSPWYWFSIVQSVSAQLLRQKHWHTANAMRHNRAAIACVLLVLSVALMPSLDARPHKGLFTWRTSSTAGDATPGESADSDATPGASASLAAIAGDGAPPGAAVEHFPDEAKKSAKPESFAARVDAALAAEFQGEKQQALEAGETFNQTKTMIEKDEKEEVRDAACQCPTCLPACLQRQCQPSATALFTAYTALCGLRYLSDGICCRPLQLRNPEHFILRYCMQHVWPVRRWPRRPPTANHRGGCPAGPS